MKKCTIIISSFLAVIILILIVFYLNSFNVALFFNGYSTRSIMYLEEDFNANNNEFKIIKTHSKTNDIVLVYMEKSYGFWKVLYNSESLKDSKMASIGWMNSAGFKRFNFDDEIDFTTEWNRLYYGENAIKLIELSQEDMPFGIAVNINQTKETYIIHIVSYEQPEVLNKLDIFSILKEKAFIK